MKMNLKIDGSEKEIIHVLNSAVKHESVRTAIDSVILQIERKLIQDVEASLA